MKVYALRHKETGKYFPSRKGRGFSHDEPTAMEGNMRIFLSLKSARNALIAWRMGKFRNSYHSTKWGDEPCLEVKEVPGRKEAPIEIVTFNLVEEL